MNMKKSDNVDNKVKIDNKIDNKLIYDVVSDFLGEEAAEVIIFLKGKEKTSEFEVAKFLKRDVQYARTLLYKLYENNLAVFEKRKDRQKGWYVTYWDFYPDNIPFLYKKLKKEKIEKLTERLKKEEENDFYMCKNACVRMDFDKAFDFNFKCPECGQLMNPIENKRTIEFIKEKIEEIMGEKIKKSEPIG